MSFQNPRLFILSPPDRGSFPLDHHNLCKRQMMEYILKNDRDNTKCRVQAKDYLACRMDNNLMAQEGWNYLGFDESIEVKSEKHN